MLAVDGVALGKRKLMQVLAHRRRLHRVWDSRWRLHGVRAQYAHGARTVCAWCLLGKRKQKQGTKPEPPTMHMVHMPCACCAHAVRMLCACRAHTWYR